MPDKVFPTHVGMVRIARPHETGSRRFPHARGDGPDKGVARRRMIVFSPRTWGWSPHRQVGPQARPVFPTHVGMVRAGIDSEPDKSGFPHARGDGPARERQQKEAVRFSPRTWGWSGYPRAPPACAWVFPTHVGMVRNREPGCQATRCFPHARGDGPFKAMAETNTEWFSPRTWGWSGRSVYRWREY